MSTPVALLGQDFDSESEDENFNPAPADDSDNDAAGESDTEVPAKPTINGADQKGHRSKDGPATEADDIDAKGSPDRDVNESPNDEDEVEDNGKQVCRSLSREIAYPNS